jgi:hypothetical protein
MKYLYFFLLSIGFCYAQIGINNPTPNLRAELDITSTSKGFLIPRFSRASVGAPFPSIVSPAESLLIYQNNTVGTDTDGFYYYFAPNWIPFRNYLDWTSAGNTTIDPTKNYTGTSDVQPFIFKTSAVERIRILADGKVGIGTATPSVDLEINSTTANALRIDDGYQGTGNLLASTANGTTVWRTPAELGFAAWNITGNSGTKPPANSLGTIDTADLSIRAGGVEAMVIQGTGGIGNEGNVRINDTAATLSQLRVKSNTSNGQTIKGKNTNTTIGNINFGVWGETNCLTIGSYAVRGTCFSDLGTTSTGNGGGIGVLGKYQLRGAGVFGRAWYTGSGANTLYNYPAANYVDFIPGRDYGVYGLVNYNPGGASQLTASGVAIYGKNPNLTIGVSYGMYCEWNMAVGGSGAPTSTNGAGVAILKAASVPTTQGNQLLYCKESPEMWFEDFGSGQLQNGSVHVALDAMFLETVFIDATHKMHVVLQEQAESKGLYCIVDADYKGFTVKEKKGGNSNSAFSYSIMAKRRFYQDQRFGVDTQQPFEDNLSKAKAPMLLTSDPMVMKAELEKGIAEKEASFRKQKQEETSTKKETSKTSN